MVLAKTHTCNIHLEYKRASKEDSVCDLSDPIARLCLEEALAEIKQKHLDLALFANGTISS